MTQTKPDVWAPEAPFEFDDGDALRPGDTVEGYVYRGLVQFNDFPVGRFEWIIGDLKLITLVGAATVGANRGRLREHLRAELEFHLQHPPPPRG